MKPPPPADERRTQPPQEEHKAHAPRHLTFAIVTVSDTRTLETDESGKTIESLLRDAGHTVAGRVVVKDEASGIRAAVERFAAARDVQCVVTTGGTGLAPRDVSVEALRPLFQKELPGFGEALRAMSQATVGTSAMMTRATCGTVNGGGGAKVVFVLPGSRDACELAVTRLILPEAPHMVALANPSSTRVRGHAP